MVKYLLSLDKLKQNQESNYYLLKADFLWKVALKILNGKSALKCQIQE